MMYNNKMVAVIKVDGKILREHDGCVYIPFGSEYEITLKNLHTTSAVVDITIDGKDVLDGSSLVVRPNKDSNIEGFLRGGKVSHKFKFIEKTEEISEFRGDDISDGLVRISFKFEKPVVIGDFFTNSNLWAYNNRPSFDGSSGTPLRSMYCEPTFGACVDNHTTKSVSTNDAGITVNGSASDQAFQYASTNPLESVEHSIVLYLKGEYRSGPVKQPILVQTKLRCDTCGHTSKSKARFCITCGTSLVV